MYLNNNNITVTAAHDIATVILSNNKVKILDLGDNDLQTVGIIQIAKALHNVSSLTELYINNNNITEEAARDIAAVILSNKIQKLDLSDNDLFTSGIVEITQALQTVSSLIELYILGNSFGSNATDSIAAVILRNAKLQILNLSHNDLNAADAIKIANALQKISSLAEVYITADD